jgi:Na+-driven multidrug efflux pump
MLIVSGINTLGDHAIKANTIAGNIDAITYIACNAFSAAAMTFAGQNYGAGRFDRVKKTVIYGLIQVTMFGIAFGQIFLLFADQLSSLYIASDDPYRAEILALTEGVLLLLLNIYFVCGLMDVMAGVLKGLGYSLAPMIISVICICGIRIVWRYAAFPLETFNSIEGIYLSYPISWSVAFVCYLTLYIFARRKVKRLTAAKEISKESKVTVEV